MTKLNQILSVEKRTKGHAHKEITAVHQSLAKAGLLAGFVKTYRAKDEDGETFPPESQRVQVNATEALGRVERALQDLFDVSFQRDEANCRARADIVVDGRVILEDVPATFLLFLEKQIGDIHTLLGQAPVLDAAEDWSLDPNSSLYKTAPTETVRTKKVQRPIVLYDATEKHPAQTQLITEDVSIGTWSTVRQSGALPLPKRQALVDRCDRLLKAVKFAREEANGKTEVTSARAGAAVLGYLFEPLPNA